MLTIINVTSNQVTINSNNNLSLKGLTKYLVEVDKPQNKLSTKKVVLLVSAEAFVNGAPSAFVNAIPLQTAKRELTKSGYSVITLSTPCAIRCIDEYTELAVLITELNADAVIYKGIHSDFGTDILDSTLSKANIPIYTFGSEVAINYKLYTGPDNAGLAKAVKTSLEKEAEKGDKVIYIDTTYKFSGDVYDNGYQRIKAAKQYLTEIGLEEVETIHTFWNRARTFEEVTRVLKTEEVDYIIAPSIETALGASEALQLLGYNNIKIIAMDFTKKGVELLKEGKLYGLVSQELEQQGFALALSIMENDNILPKTKMLFSSDTIITLENLSNYEITKDVYKW